MSNALVTATKPKAPIAARHHKAIGASRDIDGRISLPADNEALIPVDDCKAIIAEMEAAVAGCDGETASRTARAILAAYPNIPRATKEEVENGRLYAQSIAMACSKCPPDLLADLYQAVVGREQPFAPVAGEIQAIIRELTRKRRQAIDVAKAHLRAHERRGKDEPVKRYADLTEAEREAFHARIDAIKARVQPDPDAGPVDVPRHVTSALFGAGRLTPEAKARLRAQNIIKAT